MLKQQINLYTPPSSSVEMTWSGEAQLQIFLIAIAVLAVVSIMQTVWLSVKQSTVSSLTEQLVMLEKELQKTQRQYPKPVTSVKVEKMRRSVESEYHSKKKLLASLNNRSLGEDEGFSEYLSGLSNQHVNGLWLTRVNLAQGGKNVSLSGMTVEAANVPMYLQNLKKEQVFLGRKFELFEVAVPETGEPGMQFDIKASIQ